MNKNIKNKVMRPLLLCLLTMLATLTATAENRLYIQEATVVPGDNDVTLNVVLDNEDAISSLQFDIYLPDGMTMNLDEQYGQPMLERNTARTTRTSHTLNINERMGAVEESAFWRVTLFAKSPTPAKTAINGNSGNLLSFKVSVDPNFTGGTIYVNEVYGSDATQLPAVEKPMQGNSVSIKADAGTFSLSPDAASLTLIKKDTIDFFLANKVPVVGLECSVNLPEGVEVEEALMGDRLSDNAVVTYIGTSKKLLIESMTNDPFSEDKDKPVFSLVLKGLAPGEGELSLQNVLVSNAVSAFAVEGEPAAVSVTVVDINSIVYEELSAKLAEVQKALDDTLAVILAYTTEEGRAWADSAMAMSLVNDLSDEKLNMAAAYNEGTLTEEYPLYEALATYTERIKELAQNAAEAEAKALIPTGDVNSDGNVNIADANMIVGDYLGDEQEGYNAAEADVNEDGSVNIADANVVVGIYLGE